MQCNLFIKKTAFLQIISGKPAELTPLILISHIPTSEKQTMDLTTRSKTQNLSNIMDVYSYIGNEFLILLEVKLIFSILGRYYFCPTSFVMD